MKSWWIRSQDGKITLEMRDVAVPQAGRGEILLRVRSSALNRGEFNVGYQLDGLRLGGVEAAGAVHAVGEGVEGIKPGERVMGRTKGGFAEYVLLDAGQAIPIPEHLTWDQAATVPVVFLIGYEMLYSYGRLQAGEWLLVTGASSGVGVACLQMGKVIGASVIGTSGSAHKLASLKALGLDVGIHTREPDFAAQVKTLTGGKGANLIVNNVGGSVFPECLRALAFRGRLATIGSMDGVMKCEIDLAALHTYRFELFGVSNRYTTPLERAQTVRDFKRDLLPAFADERIAPAVDRIFAFDELPAARSYMESNAHVGKIVLRVT